MRLRAFAIVVGLSAALTVVALGSIAASSSVEAKRAPSCAGKSKNAASAAIEQAYETVLRAAGPERTLDERFALVEGSDEPEMRAVLDATAAENADALPRTGVEVLKVTCTGRKSADVLFELVVDGKPAPGLAPLGRAVVQDRVWKMTQRPACNLVSLADPTVLEHGPCADVLDQPA